MSHQRPHTPETRARMSASIKARMADPEVRARMSATAKALWADPAMRARMTAGQAKGRSKINRMWTNPATRERIIAAQKKGWSKKKTEGRCPACEQGNCLLCDGDGCRCFCAVDLDRVRRRPA